MLRGPLEPTSTSRNLSELIVKRERASGKALTFTRFHIILRRRVTGTPPVTHIYIEPSSNQRSTTSREASAAGRLRPNGLPGKVPPSTYTGDLPTFWELRGMM